MVFSHVWECIPLHLGFHILFHMVFHLYGEINAFPSLPLWFSRHFLQGISHTNNFHINFHRKGYLSSYWCFTSFSHLILWNTKWKRGARFCFTWFFHMVFHISVKWGEKNHVKTLWTPCENLSKIHMVFTCTSHAFHRVAPSSDWHLSLKIDVSDLLFNIGWFLL